MKIRTGFVSNSSSSSFCIYGTFVETDEFRKIIKKMKGLDEENEDEPLIDDYEDGDQIANKFGLEFHSFDGSNGYYFGRSWSSIGNKETGGEFKKSVAKQVAKLLGRKDQCGTHEEAFYC